jgi:hypothetical protein
MPAPHPDAEPDSRFRRYANWSMVIGTGLGTSSFSWISNLSFSGCGFAGRQLVYSDFRETLRGLHWRTVVGDCRLLRGNVVEGGEPRRHRNRSAGVQISQRFGSGVLWILCFLALILGCICGGANSRSLRGKATPTEFWSFEEK